MKTEILQFHYEEVVYALIILATDLKNYAKEDLACFAEAIQRLDTLADPPLLKKMQVINHSIDETIIGDIMILKEIVSQFYSNQWHLKLSHDTEDRIKSHNLSIRLLRELNEKIPSPFDYAENNMTVSW